MNLAGGRVYLRPLEEKDLPIVTKWGENAELQLYMDGDCPKTIEEAHLWMQKARKCRHSKLLAIETYDGQLIGDIELCHISWRRGDCELRIRLGEEAHRNRGFGTDALFTALEYGFIHVHLKQIYLRVYSFNHRAIRCYEKCGLTKSGRLLRRGQSKSKEILLMQIKARRFMVLYKSQAVAG